jgi:hypothetical protein
MRKLLAILALGGMLSFGALTPAVAANEQGDGLVDVEVENVKVLNDVTILLLLPVVLQLCPNINVTHLINIFSDVDDSGNSKLVCVQDDGDKVWIKQN